MGHRLAVHCIRCGAEDSVRVPASAWLNWTGAQPTSGVLDGAHPLVVRWATQSICPDCYAAVMASFGDLARHQQGLDRGNGTVKPGVVEQSIRKLEDRVGHDLGADQAAAIRSITQSGHQFQAVEGLAGAGKTTAMSAAVDAWQAAGYQIVAAAPFGAAARKLETEIGIPTRAVAGLLETMKHNGPDRVLDTLTVVLIDEASTLSTRQTGDLYHAVHQTGATLRTIGDPLQHSSVEAGGLWQAVVASNQATTPVMDVNRRQSPETLATVREALDSYRQGDISKGLEYLDTDGRIVTAESWPELLDHLAEDWLGHHLTAVEEGRAPTQMIAERNRDRAELNQRAQALLKAQGRLGAGFEIGDSTFHIDLRNSLPRAEWCVRTRALDRLNQFVLWFVRRRNKKPRNRETKAASAMLPARGNGDCIRGLLNLRLSSRPLPLVGRLDRGRTARRRALSRIKIPEPPDLVGHGQ